MREGAVRPYIVAMRTVLRKFWQSQEESSRLESMALCVPVTLSHRPGVAHLWEVRPQGKCILGFRVRQLGPLTNFASHGRRSKMCVMG